jgi:hypothetical protein
MKIKKYYLMIILLFHIVLLNYTSYSQINELKGNIKLYDSIKKQDKLFDDILLEFTKDKRTQDFINKKNNDQINKFRKQIKNKKTAIKILSYQLEKKDSILLKLNHKLDLLETYRKIKAINIQNIKKTEREKNIIQEYYLAKLSLIDSYFKDYLSNQIYSEYTSDKVSTFLNGTPPSLGKCIENNDKLECLKSKIYEKLVTNIIKPNYRKTETEPVSKIKILINEEGKLSVYKIEKSSGYFEYDYEIIESLLTTFKDILFTPAQSLGFEDPYYLDIIVNYNQL